MTIRTAAFLLLSLLIPTTLSAAEWRFTDREWNEGQSEHAAATFTRSANELVVAAGRDRAVRFERTLDLDGDDEEPLIISCALSAQGERALAQAPLGFSVVWPDAQIFVGVASSRDMRGVARWQLSGAVGSATDSTNLDPASYLNYVRIVVTKRVIVCAVSGDGATWRTIHELERQGPLAVAPMRVVLGAGWGGEASLDRTADRATAAPKDDEVRSEYRFTQLSVARWQQHIPTSLLATYKRGESREATIDVLLADSFPRTWWTVGPFASGKSPYGPEQEPFDPAKPVVSGDETHAWEAITIGDEIHQRLVVLDKRRKTKGRHVYFATTVIESSAARRVRFLYDGYAAVALFVNGQALSVNRQARSGAATAELDRLSAYVDLQAGRNEVTLRLTTSDNGGCAFIFRMEPGDPRYRIALERRLALDFAHDADEVSAGLFESARLWEELGHALAAIGILDEIIANEEMPAAMHERALLERTRLHAHLRNQEEVDRDVAAVRSFWSDNAGVDQATVLRRAADLWSRLDQGERANRELVQAINIEGLSRERRFDLLLEQIRLVVEAGNADQVSTVVAEAVTHFPADDRLRAYVAAESKDAAAAKAMVAQRDPLVLRIVAGIARAANDTATLTAALRNLVELELAGPGDDPAVTLAEHLSATGDRAGALAAYRTALARLGVTTAVDSIEKARSAYLDARLSRIPGVSEILALPADVDPGIAAETPILDWRVIGPFPNPDWQAYEKPPIDAGRTRGKGKEKGQEWRATSAGEHYRDQDILEFKRIYNVDHHVVVCYREITSAFAIDAELSFGADDGIIVWLNGKKIYEDREQRGVTRDSLSVAMPLQKGTNRLVVQVQNGTGGWDLQARVLIPAQADSQLGNALRTALAAQADRTAIATALAEACRAGLRFGRGDLVAMLAPALLAAFPDQGDLLVPLARRFIDGATANRYPDAAVAAIRWWDARDRMDFTVGEDRPRLGEHRLGAARILIEQGVLTEAADLLDALTVTSTDARRFSSTLRLLGDLRLLLGDASGAQRWFERAVAVRGGDDDAQRRSRQALAAIRRFRTAVRPVTASLDATTAMQTAERAAAANDIEHAEQAFQQALVSGVGEVLPTADNLHVGIAWWSIQRLRSLSAESQAAYRQRFGQAAEKALAAAIAIDDEDALEHVAARWPITSAAATALIEAAQRYRAAGARDLAAATARLAGERFQLTGDLAATAKALQTVSPTMAAPSPTAVVGAAPIALPPSTLHDLKRFVPEGERPVHVPLVPAVGDGLAVVHSGVEVVGFDLASGRERWRQPAAGVGQPSRPEHRGQRLFGAVIMDGVAVGLSVAGATPLIEARDTSDGTLRWATQNHPGLDDFTPIAAPASDGSRVLLFGVDGERGVLCAVRPRDGKVLWRTTLPVALADVVLHESVNFALGRNQGPPVVVDRDIFVTLDSGALISVDAPTGMVRWVATYPRGVFHSEGSRRIIATLLERSPGAIAVGAEQVVLLPRDRSGVYAFSRRDGSASWSIDNSDARVLVGSYRSGDREVALLAGSSLQAIDLAAGEILWTWRSGDGPVIGSPLAVGDTVYVSTAQALHQLRLGNGQPSEAAKPWRALGYAGSTPGQFQVHGDRLLAASAAGLVVLAKAVPPAKPAVLIPSAPRSAGPQPVVPAAVDPGGTLGIAWHQPGDGFVATVTPEDPRPDELYLRLDSGLLRMTPDLRSVVWHLRLPADLRGVAIQGDQVLTITDGTLVAYHRDHGTIRWAAAVSPNPAREPSEPERLRVGLGKRLALAFSHGHPWLTVRDARNGALIWHGVFQHHDLIWAGEVGDDLVTVAAIGAKRIVIQRRDPAQPATVRSETAHEMNTNGVTGRSVPGRPILVIMGEEAVWLDLAKAEATPLKLGRGWPLSLDVNGDGIDIITRVGRQSDYHVLDAATGAVRFTQQYHDGWLSPNEYFGRSFARIGDLLVRQTVIKGGATQISGIHLDGTERFAHKGEHFHRLRPLFTLAVAGHFHAFAQVSGRLHVRRLAGDGTVASEALIPVNLSDSLLRFQVEKDLVILDSSNGVVILRGLGEPATVAADAPASEQELRARLGIQENTAVITPLLATLPLIDGHLDEWSAETANVVEGNGIRTVGVDDLTLPPPMRWWSGYTSAGLVIAAEVGAATPAITGFGLPPLATPGLLVGVAPLDEGRDEHTFVFHLGVENGRTICRVVRGGPVVGDLPQARASRAGDVTRYELAIPWTLLRQKEELRPGNRNWMRLALAAIDPGRGTVREAGFGLVTGTDSRWWIPAELKR